MVIIYSHFLKQNIVVDTETYLFYVGQLVQFEERSFLLSDVLIIDTTIIKIPVEKYLIECSEQGFSPSRKSIWINANKVISISLLSDIIIL